MSNQRGINWKHQTLIDHDHVISQNEPSCISIQMDSNLHKMIKNQTLQRLNIHQKTFYNHNRFPLYQPKTFNHITANKSSINHVEWFVSLKSDGSRYMMTSFQLDDRFLNAALLHLMIDRNFRMFIIHIEEKTVNHVPYIMDCEFIVRNSNQPPYMMLHCLDMWYYKNKLLKRNIDRFCSMCEWFEETIDTNDYTNNIASMYRNMEKLAQDTQCYSLYDILKQNNEKCLFSYIWNEWKQYEKKIILNHQPNGVNTFISKENKTITQSLPCCIKPFVPCFCTKEVHKYYLNHLKHNDGLIFCDTYHIYKYKSNYTVDVFVESLHTEQNKNRKILHVNKMDRSEQVILDTHGSKRVVLDAFDNKSYKYDYSFMDESSQYFYYCQFEVDSTSSKSFDEHKVKSIMECCIVPEQKTIIQEPVLNSHQQSLTHGKNLMYMHCFVRFVFEKRRTDKNYCNNEKTLQQSIHLQINPINIKELFD